MTPEELANLLQLPGPEVDLTAWMGAFLNKRATISSNNRTRALTADGILAVVQAQAQLPAATLLCPDFGYVAANALLQLCELTPVRTIMNEGWELSWQNSESQFYAFLQYVVTVLNAIGSRSPNITLSKPPPSFYLQLWALLAEWKAMHPPPRPDPCALVLPGLTAKPP